MSRWGSAFRIAAAAVVAFGPWGWFTAGQSWALFASQVESERQRRKRDKVNSRARAAFNDAQKDRLQMVDLQPDQARTLALARVGYVEGQAGAVRLVELQVREQGRSGPPGRRSAPGRAAGA